MKIVSNIDCAAPAPKKIGQLAPRGRLLRLCGFGRTEKFVVEVADVNGDGKRVMTIPFVPAAFIEVRQEDGTVVGSGVSVAAQILAVSTKRVTVTYKEL